MELSKEILYVQNYFSLKDTSFPYVLKNLQQNHNFYRNLHMYPSLSCQLKLFTEQLHSQGDNECSNHVNHRCMTRRLDQKELDKVFFFSTAPQQPELFPPLQRNGPLFYMFNFGSFRIYFEVQNEINILF